ncbi:MAG: hypothetical protein F6K19_49125 [Cyanothece sp. SIO1E1]|nr:hypothetical protein [Cyanothece sp. SIO1E1]
MFMIDLTLKNSPVTLSVQRKSGDEALALYQKILETISSGNPITLELTCEQQPEKKIGVLVSEISAVQISEKAGTAAASGKPPGFFALAE